MKKIFTIFLSLILCACCMLSFSACDDKTVNKDNIINPRTETKKVGYIEYAPLNYMYKGKFTGYNTKLAVSVFNTLGYNVEFVLIEPTDKDRRVVNADDVFSALDNGEIDCFWGGITDAVLNDDSKFDFSYRYMENSPCLVINENQNQINSESNFDGKTISFGKFSSGELYYNSTLSKIQNISLDFESCENGQKSALHKANSLLEEANCAIVDTLFAYYNIEKTNEYGDLTLNSTKLHPATYQIEQQNFLRVVFKKSTTGTNELRDNVNKTLEFFASLTQTSDAEIFSLLEIPAIGINFVNADLKDFLITDFTSQK